MTEMIERVAKAIRMKAAEIDQRPNVHEADPMWFANEYARAAIEAMREPTSAMVTEAMIQPHPSVAESGGIIEQGRAAVIIDWQAMIDQALAELGPQRDASTADEHGVPRAEE